MNVHELMETAQAMVADDKGLLAMDESHPTCNKRFAQVGIPQTVEARRAYRELLVTTPRLGECISGAILYDETIRQQKKDGTSFVDVLIREGIIPGIKVDLGATEVAGFPGEKVTEGLDGLRERLHEYAHLGARFAKWRAVLAIGETIPHQGVYRDQYAGVGSLCCIVSGSRAGPYRRTRSAYGWRPYASTMR
jgi:fructose-bisphosphate aldolase, class I